MFEKLRVLFEHRVETTHISSRRMTEADWAHFDAAAKKIDEAFTELRKIKP